MRKGAVASSCETLVQWYAQALVPIGVLPFYTNECPGASAEQSKIWNHALGLEARTATCNILHTLHNVFLHCLWEGSIHTCGENSCRKLQWPEQRNFFMFTDADLQHEWLLYGECAQSGMYAQMHRDFLTQQARFLACSNCSTVSNAWKSVHSC